VLALPLPQLKEIRSKPTIPREAVRRWLARFGERYKNKMANASAKARIHQPGGGIVLNPRRGRATNCVLVVEEGGSVVIVNVEKAPAPLLRFNGDAGLSVQEAPAMRAALQFSATLLEMLLSGFTVTAIEPDCPAVIVRLGAAVATVKSGIATLMNWLALNEDA
jgi:hypothetical protein